MKHTFSPRRVVAGVAALLVGLSMTACSANAPGTSPAPGAPGAPTAGAPASPVASPITKEKAGGPKDEIPNFGEDAAGIRKDVKLESCTYTQGDVVAKGTVTNSADGPRDIYVSVLWMGPNNETLSIKTFTAKDVAAGKSETFDLASSLPIEGKRCLVNAKSAAVGTLK